MTLSMCQIPRRTRRPGTVRRFDAIVDHILTAIGSDHSVTGRALLED
jgi:hypothetical protein